MNTEKIRSEILKVDSWKEKQFIIDIGTGMDYRGWINTNYDEPDLDNGKLHISYTSYMGNGAIATLSTGISIRKIKSIRLAKPSDYGNYTEE